MTKKKRKTLPENFSTLIEAGNIEELKAVFATCELDAYGGYSKGTALSFYQIPEELVVWLVAQGADINAVDRYKRTPLYQQASTRGSLVALFIELGADIHQPDYQNDTPLHNAASSFQPSSVKILIEKGADMRRKNNMGRTPLEKALSQCQNSHIRSMAQVAAVFLEEGIEITSGMKESVQRIGVSFEFFRDNFNKDNLKETEEGLNKLYELFHVLPVQRRRIHDGISPITVSETTWEKQHAELWDYLVPGQGFSKTIQGEVIRIVGKISREILTNGGCNWDSGYRELLDELLTYFKLGKPLSERDLEEAKTLVKIIRPEGNGLEIPSKLTELGVKWVVENPTPIPLGKPKYQR